MGLGVIGARRWNISICDAINICSGRRNSILHLNIFLTFINNCTSVSADGFQIPQQHAKPWPLGAIKRDLSKLEQLIQLTNSVDFINDWAFFQQF